MYETLKFGHQIFNVNCDFFSGWGKFLGIRLKFMSKKIKKTLSITRYSISLNFVEFKYFLWNNTQKQKQKKTFYCVFIQNFEVMLKNSSYKICRYFYYLQRYHLVSAKMCSFARKMKNQFFLYLGHPQIMFETFQKVTIFSHICTKYFHFAYNK